MQSPPSYCSSAFLPRGTPSVAGPGPLQAMGCQGLNCACISLQAPSPGNSVPTSFGALFPITQSLCQGCPPYCTPSWPCPVGPSWSEAQGWLRLRYRDMACPYHEGQACWTMGRGVLPHSMEALLGPGTLHHRERLPRNKATMEKTGQQTGRQLFEHLDTAVPESIILLH